MPIGPTLAAEVIEPPADTAGTTSVAVGTEAPAEPAAGRPPQAASVNKQRRAYSVQFSYSGLPGRRRPGEFTREAFGLLLFDVHAAAFRDRATPSVPVNAVAKVMVCQEVHANGEFNLYAGILCDRPYRSNDIQERLRAVRVYVSFGCDDVYFWPIVVYMGVPSVHKSEAEIDRQPWHSDGKTMREELADMPKGVRQSEKVRVRAYLGLATASTASKFKGLSPDEFAEMVRGHEWRSRDEVLGAARDTRASAPALYEHVLRMGRQRLDESLEWIWEMEGSAGELDVDRLAKLLAVADTATCECGGRWTPAAERLLQLQGISSEKFRSVIVRALRWGRCKWVNPLIVGEPDSGKSFLIRPIAKIFKAFIRRGQKETFPLQGLHGSEVCVLQDIRYESFGLPWDDWLTWGEGEDIMVRLPRCTFAEGKMYKGRAPLLSTMADLFTYPIPEARQTGRSIERENYQFRERWAIVPFRHPVPEDERDPTLVPCAKCSAQWYGAAVDAVRAAGPPARVTETWLRSAVPFTLPVQSVAPPAVCPATGSPASSSSANGGAASQGGIAPRPPDYIEQVASLIDLYRQGLISNADFWQVRQSRGLL